MWLWVKTGGRWLTEKEHRRHTGDLLGLGASGFDRRIYSHIKEMQQMQVPGGVALLCVSSVIPSSFGHLELFHRKRSPRSELKALADERNEGLWTSSLGCSDWS